jgi:N-alpha-acetyltransferase 30
MSFEANRLGDVILVPYKGEEQLPSIQALIDRDLSEPYSVFTYRYFLLEWPHLCFLALEPKGDCVGTVISKLVRKIESTLLKYLSVL